MTRLKRKKGIPGSGMDVRFGTPPDVAAYRARRIAKAMSGNTPDNMLDVIIEIGAGAGHQTRFFSKIAKRVIAVDIDSERLLRGGFDKNVTVIAGDAMDDAVFEKIRALCEDESRNCEDESGKGGVGADDTQRKDTRRKIVIFLDPERPSEAKRRTIDEIKPNIRDFVKKYSSISQNIAIELPPFTTDVPFDCEREYLSINFQLNRLTIYFGELKLARVSAVQLLGARGVAHGGDRGVDRGGEHGDVHDGERSDEHAGGHGEENEHRVERKQDDVLKEKEELLSNSQVKYLLEPDLAVAKAGLIYNCLDVPYQERLMGKKIVLLTQEDTKNPFFKRYRILAGGKKQVLVSLHECGLLILHGSMDENDQRKLLRELNPLCKGKERLHLFIGDEWYLCRHKA